MALMEERIKGQTLHDAILHADAPDAAHYLQMSARWLAFVLMPLYYRLQLTSIYGYLGDRFGPRSYLTGAWFFLLSRSDLLGMLLIGLVAIIVLITINASRDTYQLNAVFDDVRGQRLHRAAGLAGKPPAELPAVEPRVDERNRDLDQIFRGVVELADVTAPRNLAERGNACIPAGGPFSGRGLRGGHAHPCPGSGDACAFVRLLRSCVI